MRLKAIGLMVTLACGLSLLPIAADTQPSARLWRIGLFHVGLDHVPPSLDGLREGLTAFGYEEGKNIRLDWRNLADEDAAHATAQEFVREHVDLIVAFENQTVRAAKAATSEIPVVFLHVEDPVAAGLVASLAHPGGNLTGFAGFLWDFPDKKLELFKALVPHLRRLLVLKDPEDPLTPRLLERAQTAAAVLQLQSVEREATHQADLERLFGSLAPETVDGVFVISPDLYVKFSSLILHWATENRLPFPGYRKEWVAQGALFSYAPNIRTIGVAAAEYIHKILHGANPATLPVQQPTKFDFVINLKTAQALGLTISPTVLFQADEVIR